MCEKFEPQNSDFKARTRFSRGMETVVRSGAFVKCFLVTVITRRFPQTGTSSEFEEFCDVAGKRGFMFGYGNHQHPNWKLLPKISAGS